MKRFKHTVHYKLEEPNPKRKRQASCLPSMSSKDNSWSAVPHYWAKTWTKGQEEKMHAGDGPGSFGDEKGGFDVVLPNTDSATPRGLAKAGWNVRSVGFIAKPEKTHELQTCITESVNNLLQQVPGFLGAIVLHSKHEERNLLVLTFWETEKQAASNRWEEFQAVRKVLSPIVDVCTKVQTFRATVPPISATTNAQKAAEIC